METRHVRIRVTPKDLEEFKLDRGVRPHQNERRNPIARAINRTLRPGFAATFDGMSIGILNLNAPTTTATPLNHVYDEIHDGMSSEFRRISADGVNPFFRSADERVQKFHQRVMAHRKVHVPGRFTVSLPRELLKRERETVTAEDVGLAHNCSAEHDGIV